MADAAAHADEHHDTRGFFTRWFMSTNHKDIGILYLFTAAILGFVSVGFTVYMRMELMEPGVQYMYLAAELGVDGADRHFRRHACRYDGRDERCHCHCGRCRAPAALRPA